MREKAALAEHWLTPVFDEYRFCSLGNLYRSLDSNDPLPTSLHFIDEQDRDVFMEDWGHNCVVKGTVPGKINTFQT